MINSIESIKQDLINICFEAGQAILEIYDNIDAQTIITKDDGSPLTKADLASHEIISEHLKQLTPNVPLLSEESTSKKLIQSDYYWLVDPLDGTKEFINRNGEFTVNIALIENNKPVLGLVYAPVLNKLYYGNVKALEAFVLEDDNKKTIQVTQTRPGTLKVVGSRSHQNMAELEQFLDGKPSQIVPCGSSLKFCLVAEGKADLYPRLGPTMIWDTAAGHAVVLAAGGTVSDLEGNSLSYDATQLRNPHFVVSY